MTDGMKTREHITILKINLEVLVKEALVKSICHKHSIKWRLRKITMRT